MHAVPNILVVEPYTATRTELCRVLRLAGFRTCEAYDGGEAIELGDSLRVPVHMVITELALPDTNGLLVIRRLSQRRPMLRSLIMSAHCDDVVCLHPELSHRVQFLAKPIQPSAVVTRVRQIFGLEPRRARTPANGSGAQLTRRPRNPMPAEVRIALCVARARKRALAAQSETAAAAAQNGLIRARICDNMSALRLLGDLPYGRTFLPPV